MDLSFAHNGPGVTALPTELAVLLVGVAARQAASPTARIQALFALTAPDADPLAPDSGAFNGAAATTLTRWQEG